MLRGIRGAITAKANTKAEILSATEKLLSEMVKENAIKTEDIASVIFTVSPDLNAEFPAKAARKNGWNDVPLLCASEINVPHGLKQCIRILIHLNTDKSQKNIKHIYLDGAKGLREEQD